jgi:hypothetical protein
VSVRTLLTLEERVHRLLLADWRRLGSLSTGAGRLQWVDSSPPRRVGEGRSLAVKAHPARWSDPMQTTEPVECNDWSVAMQTGGQVECNSPLELAVSLVTNDLGYVVVRNDLFMEVHFSGVDRIDSDTQKILDRVSLISVSIK